MLYIFAIILNKIIRFLLIILFSFILNSSFFAQNKGVILGSIKDKNTDAPIEGVVVQVDGTADGTATDNAGNYLFETTLGAKNLKVSFLCYATQNKYNIIVSSGNAQIVNFELSEEANTLKEVTIERNTSHSARAADMVTPMSTQRLTSEEIKSNPDGNFDVSR